MSFNELNFDDDYKENMAPTMIRQRHKMQLIETTNAMLDAFSKYRSLWGKKYKKAVNDVFKDYFKGVKVINKKNPIFLEMPKLVAVGKDTGQIKKVYEGQNPEEVDVEVHSQLDNNESALINQETQALIENKDNNQII